MIRLVAQKTADHRPAAARAVFPNRRCSSTFATLLCMEKTFVSALPDKKS
jgi:hypothetical protein